MRTESLWLRVFGGICFGLELVAVPGLTSRLSSSNFVFSVLQQSHKASMSCWHGASVQRQGVQEVTSEHTPSCPELANYWSVIDCVWFSDLQRCLLPSGDYGPEGLLSQWSQWLPGADESATDTCEEPTFLHCSDHTVLLFDWLLMI